MIATATNVAPDAAPLLSLLDVPGDTASVGAIAAHVALAALVVALAYGLTRAVRPAQRALIRRGSRQAHRVLALVPAITLIIWIAAAVIALALIAKPLGAWGPWVWIIACVILLFGLRDVLRQMVAGVFIILQGRIRPGEVVRIGDLRGRVERIGLQRIVLRGADGLEHTVPPSSLMDREVVRESLPTARPVRLRIEVPTSVDPQRAARLLYEVAALSPYADPRCRPEVAIELEGNETWLSLWGRATAPAHERRYRTQVTVRMRRELEAVMS